MRMRCRHNLRPRHMQPGVNGEGGLIDFTIAFDDYSLLIHQDQVGDANMPKMHAEGIDPEVVLELGVASRDMPRPPFAKTKLCEQPKSGGQPLLAVHALLRHGREGRWIRSFCDLDLS